MAEGEAGNSRRPQRQAEGGEHGAEAFKRRNRAAKRRRDTCYGEAAAFIQRRGDQPCRGEDKRVINNCSSIMT